MQPVRKPAMAAAAPAAAQPARPPVRKPTPAPVSSAAALQSRIGAGGMRQMVQRQRGAKPPPRAGAKAPEPGGRRKREKGEGKAPAAAGKIGAAGAGTATAKAAAPVADAAPVGDTKAAGPGPPVQLHMPEPPKGPSPATVKRIQGVQARAAGKAAAQADLPAAEKQVGDAQQAVTPPETERAARAQADLIATVKAAPSPEIVELCQKIRKVIREKRPVDEDALDAADPEAEAADAGNQLNAAVQDETQKVQDNYGAVETSPAAPAVPKAPDLAGQPQAAATPAMNAAAAKPDAVPAENLSLDQDAAEARQKTQDAGMEKPAAQLVQSGPIAEARAAQGELDETAKEGPAQVIARQEQALGKAEADMASLGAEALVALTAARQGTVKRTETGQRGMVGTEESMRLKAGQEAQAAFVEAQTLVKGLLKDLPQKAMEEWEQAKKLLVDKFKNELAIVKQRVDERHAGVGGTLLAIGDYFSGLPDWATDAYTRAENNFADGVIEKLLAISTKVNAVIEACNELIKTAREKIAAAFDALPDSLRTWAEQEKAKFGRQLDALEKEAADTRDNFNKGLKQQASAAVNEVRTEIAELRKKAGGLAGRIADAVGRFLDDPVKFIIEGLLELLGISPAAFWAVVAKIKKYTAAIADDPLGFGENLLKGLGQGFSQFFDNFGTHMIEGFLKWLFGDLKGVQVPKDFSLKSVVGFFLQLMGITWPNIRKILVKKVGAQNVALIERVWSLVSLLMEKGPEGILEMIKEMLDPQTILDQVIEMAVEYMVTAIVKSVAVRLLLLFNPVGAILQALEAIYKVLKWVFQNAARIFQLVETVVNGIGDIIAGNVAGFAGAVEKGLAMLIPPVIAFIADYFSLGDLPKAVAGEIKSMQTWVLGMIERALDWIIEKGKALLAKMGIGKKEEKKKGAEGAAIGKRVAWEAEGEAHEMWIEVKGDNATVMMASADGKAVAAELTSYEKLAMALTLEQDQERRARALDHIGKARAKLAPVDNKADAVAKEVQQPTAEVQKVESEKAQVEQAEDALWPHLQAIQIALHILPLPETLVVPAGGAKASYVTAMPLSKKPGNTIGTARGDDPSGWGHIMTIDHSLLNPKTAQYGARYWRRTHLLSAKLHGPAETWNLVPTLEKYNSALRDRPEADAKKRIARDEVLFYHVNVDFHQGPTVEDFPSSIVVRYGAMHHKDGKWTEADQIDGLTLSPEAPPLSSSAPVSINSCGRDRLWKMGLPFQLAEAVASECPYASESDLLAKLRNLYAARKRAVDFDLVHWPTLKAFMSAKNLII